MEPAVPAGTAIDSDAIAARYRERIYHYVLRLVRDRARADDLTQETFLRAHQRLAGLRDPAAVEAWLYRIASNLCYDRFRHARRRPALPLAAADTAAAPSECDEAELRPDQLLEQSEMSECVLRFLMRLPATQRSVILLHDLQGLTAPQVAAQLGISLPNAKVRLHRARVRLKAALTEGCTFSVNDRGVTICEPKPEP